MTRRELLIAGAGGVVLACAGARAARAREAQAAPEPGPELPGSTGAVLDLARRAASSHNSQPWKVIVRDASRLTVLADLTRRLPAVDPEDRELWISVGAFVETAVQGARAVGLAAEVSAPEAGGPEAAAELRLVPAGALEPALGRAIRMRRTLRKDLGSQPLAAADRDGLAAAAGPAVKVAFLERGGREAGWLTAAALAAMEAQSWRDPAQAELAEWIRFSREEEARRGDGLTPDTMELGGLAAFWMRSFMDRSDVPKPSFRRSGIDAARRQLAQGAGFFVLSTERDDRAGRLEAGRAFARLGLEAVGRGIALHPMSQVLEELEWRGQVAAATGAAGVVQLVLRAGARAYPASTVSPRRVLRDFVAVG